ncbi:MAG: M20/M25/M40 family metallo-hydrolase, partial [Sutterella sp.]|nr:M20/M25/M40 family metallo-hydrolase [Sutterella sp.]
MKTENIPPISAQAENALRTIAGLPEVRKALQSIHDRTDQAIRLQVELCEIPAPTFREEVRAKRIVELMHECGLEDVSIDGIGNVVGRWQGTDPQGPLLAIGAHMDTVFPEGTDVTVRQEGNRYYGPGIGDNCAGLRAVLETLRAMMAAGIRTKGSILFMGTVGEEGLGDIRGSKYLFDKSGLPVDGLLAVDNTDVGRILYGAIGSHRWRFTVKG